MNSDPSDEHEQQQVAEMIRSGSYYSESRAWYQALYIGPISERAFFLIVAGLAMVIFLASAIAVMSLLPINERTGVIINTPTERMDDTSMRIQRIRPQEVPLNTAMMRFFLSAYVQMREGYQSGSYAKDYQFVRAHSDASTFTAFASGADAGNPQSAAATLGTTGTRTVAVEGMSIDDKTKPMTATIRFSTTTINGGTTATITQWTATIGFNYSNLTVQTVIDPDTGRQKTQTQEPVFQVVSYATRT